MALLVGAMLSLGDALVGGLKGEHGPINLIPDSRYLISGPLPPRTTEIKDFVIEGPPKNESVRLVPDAIYSGYWFGGAMWRGAIEVAPFAPEGTYIFNVKDKFGEKQNPTLVFNVRVWPDQATLNAHSPSHLVRLTGINPFYFALSLGLCGIAAAGMNFIFGRLWARHLLTHQCGEIYKLRHTARGTEITCEIHCGFVVRPGMQCKIYRPSGEALCTAHVSGCENNEILMLVDEPQLVHMGDVACILPDLTESKQ